MQKKKRKIKLQKIKQNKKKFKSNESKIRSLHVPCFGSCSFVQSLGFCAQFVRLWAFTILCFCDLKVYLFMIFEKNSKYFCTFKFICCSFFKRFFFNFRDFSYFVKIWLCVSVWILFVWTFFSLIFLWKASRAFIESIFNFWSVCIFYLLLIWDFFKKSVNWKC